MKKALHVCEIFLEINIKFKIFYKKNIFLLVFFKGDEISNF